VYELPEHHFICLHIFCILTILTFHLKESVLFYRMSHFSLLNMTEMNGGIVKTTIFQGDLYSFIMALKKM
jgi:hypothetical protein